MKRPRLIRPHDTSSEVRFSEVISALTYALDIVEGQPEGHALRSCMIGMRLADEIDLSSRDRLALFYALQLKDLGCSSNAAKVCYLFGSDDRIAKRNLKSTNWTSLGAQIRYVAKNVATGRPLRERIRQFASVALAGEKEARNQVQLRCDRGASIAHELGLPDATADAIRALDEHWNGNGFPYGLKGDEIPRLGRILNIAQTIEVFNAEHGLEHALDVARQRRGKWFDPDLVQAFESIVGDSEFWDRVASDRVRHHVQELEPQSLVLLADESLLDRVARAFGRVIDAKSPWTYAHSQGVSDVAVGIGERLGLDDHEVTNIRRAGWLHDIGKLGISNLILDKPGRLTDEEMEEMRLHPGYTHRILERVTCFNEFADLAASHHERLDGKGYHRGLSGDQLSASARAMVVADMYEALAAKRPYRKDLSEEEVLDILQRNVGEGLCPRAYDALIDFLEETNFEPYQVAA